MTKRRDGRSLRAERSRRAVAAAMLALIREGNHRPKAAEVAERAGVSLRLVFHHFEDMAAVYREAFRMQSETVSRLLVLEVTPETALAPRLDAFAQNRARFFETVTPVRRAARYVERDSEMVASALDQVRTFKREQVAWLFGPEVAAREDRGAQCLAALQATSSWMFWESLRAHQGLAEDAAQAVLRAALGALLAG